MLLEALLRHHARTGSTEALAMAEGTLRAMAGGGMYDQLAGGFARYSVDADWVVPHFEKMLYDNGLLLRVYAHWWRATGDPVAERVVRDTAAFLLRDMRSREGAFISAAVEAAELLDRLHRDPQGRLLRVSRDGAAGAPAAVLDDLGCVADAFLVLHQVTGDDAWLTKAGALLDDALARFRDDATGGFFDTADDAESLVMRPQDPGDNASPSGWSSVASALLTYAALTGSARHRTAAEEALAPLLPLVAEHPRFSGHAMAALAVVHAGDGPDRLGGERAQHLAHRLQHRVVVEEVHGFLAGAGDERGDASDGRPARDRGARRRGSPRTRGRRASPSRPGSR